VRCPSRNRQSGGDPSQRSGVLFVRYVLSVGVPWTIPLEVGKGARVYLSGRNAKAYGSIACEIFLNGISFRRAESTGPYRSATCSGRL
jgi:hypothetical protein